MLRRLAAIILGAAAAFIVVAIVESVGHLIYPPPSGLDLSDPEALRVLISQMPPGALVAVVVAWFCGSFTGGFVAQLIAREARPIAALGAGALMLVATLSNFVLIPHPPVKLPRLSLVLPRPSSSWPPLNPLGI